MEKSSSKRADLQTWVGLPVGSGAVCVVSWSFEESVGGRERAGATGFAGWSDALAVRRVIDPPVIKSAAMVDNAGTR